MSFLQITWGSGLFFYSTLSITPLSVLQVRYALFCGTHLIFNISLKLLQTLEIISFSEKNKEFEEINASVLAISTDSHHTHLAWTRTSREDGGVGKLNIPLVADTSKKISENFNVLVTDENDDMYGAALRGLFIIDPTGIIRSIQINDDAVGRSVEETLRILKAFQWADSHVGEACPASWTPGSDTIKTNPYESKEYFKSHYAS